MSKVLLLVLILLLIFVFFFVPLEKLGFYKNTQSVPSSSPSPMASNNKDLPTASSVPFLTEDFVKRQFDPKTKFIVRENKEGSPSADYPQELLDINDNNIEGIKCTRRFFRFPDGRFYFNSDSGGVVIQTTDKDYQEALKLVNDDKGEGFDIWSFGYCLLESGGKLIQYQKVTKNSEPELPDNFIYMEASGLVKKVAANIGTPIYFSCFKPLLMTKGNILYYECGGGDITSWILIEKIDFNNLSSKKIIDCHLGEELYDGSLALECK